MTTTMIPKFTMMLGFVFCLMACQNNSPNQNQTTSVVTQVLSVNEFAKGLEAGADVQLLDVRTPEEVSGGKIENAMNCNFYDSDFREKIKQLDPEKATYVYCKKGGRSAKAAKLLEQAGFKEVYDLDGGYQAWHAAR